MKKTISLICAIWAVTLLFSSLPLVQAGTTQTHPATYPLGDVDGDKMVTAKDTLLVLQHTVGKVKLTEKQKQAAEVTGDGMLNAQDALKILKYSVEKSLNSLWKKW